MGVFKRDSLLFSVLLSLKQVRNCTSGVISPLVAEMFLCPRPFHERKKIVTLTGSVLESFEMNLFLFVCWCVFCIIKKNRKSLACVCFPKIDRGTPGKKVLL